MFYAAHFYCFHNLTQMKMVAAALTVCTQWAVVRMINLLYIV